MCLWMEILSREKLHLPIYFVLFLTTLWMCYRTIKGILGSCESLCLLFSMLSKIQKLSCWYFFLGWFLSLWDRCGSFWDRPRSFEDRCGSLWVVVGSLWVVVDRCGSLWVVVGVVPGFSNYDPVTLAWFSIQILVISKFSKLSWNISKSIKSSCL